MSNISNKQIMHKAEEIVSQMPEDLTTTIALGFYDFNGEEVDISPYDEDLDDNDYHNLQPEEDYTSRTEINNGWEPYDNWEDDNDFNYIFRKRGRRLVGKWFKKQAKGVKKTAKKVGKGIKKVAKKTWEGVKKGVKWVGKMVKKAVLFLPRRAFRGLVVLNYRGFASKFNVAMTNKKYSGTWKKIKKKWEALGGKQSSLESVIRKGKNKKMLFCGAKCKKKVADYVKKKGKKGFDGTEEYEVDTKKLYDLIKVSGKTLGFSSATGDIDYEKLDELYDENGEFYNVEPVSTATFVMVGLGGAIISALAVYLVGIKQDKTQQKAIKNEKEKNDKQLKLMAKEQETTKENMEKQINLMEMKVKDTLDPTNQILNNPDLSPAEKQEAIKQVNEALGRKEMKGYRKYLVWGAIGIVGLLVLGKVLKR